MAFLSCRRPKPLQIPNTFARPSVSRLELQVQAEGISCLPRCPRRAGGTRRRTRGRHCRRCRRRHCRLPATRGRTRKWRTSRAATEDTETDRSSLRGHRARQKLLVVAELKSGQLLIQGDKFGLTHYFILVLARAAASMAEFSQHLDVME